MKQTINRICHSEFTQMNEDKYTNFILIKFSSINPLHQ